MVSTVGGSADLLVYIKSMNSRSLVSPYPGIMDSRDNLHQSTVSMVYGDAAPQLSQPSMVSTLWLPMLPMVYSNTPSEAKMLPFMLHLLPGLSVPVYLWKHQASP